MREVSQVKARGQGRVEPPTFRLQEQASLASRDDAGDVAWSGRDGLGRGLRSTGCRRAPGTRYSDKLGFKIRPGRRQNGTQPSGASVVRSLACRPWSDRDHKSPPMMSERRIWPPAGSPGTAGWVISPASVIE
jgi:hypothetical protein